MKICKYNFPKLIFEGVTGGIIGQYISDIIFSIFVFERTDFFDIITEISPISNYYGATTSGFLNGLTNPYIDSLTSIAFRNYAYIYTSDYVSKNIGEADILEDLDYEQITADTIAIIILVFVFSEDIRNGFLNHRLKRHSLEPIYDDETTFYDTIIFIVIANLYAYYQYQRDGNLAAINDTSI